MFLCLNHFRWRKESPNATIEGTLIEFDRVEKASKLGCRLPLPAISNLSSACQYLCFSCGVFSGGDRLNNKLKKVSIGIGATCFASYGPTAVKNIKFGKVPFPYADFSRTFWLQV